ncbi:tRNA uridine(34) 5-carboxymethylaminomethyl modification radical SAM/GNAT enzyme Elp3 [Candidatus Uhrbacteria bacterium]|nr:tRNA uridine(34) 5-carboxymethylaminomethyl modification radical SAM/GNAT enzyme Elp3 [Candidatus Uhrbacteria bacterium]
MTQPKPPARLVQDAILKLAVLEMPSRQNVQNVMRQTCSGTDFRFPNSQELWLAYRALLTKKKVKKNEALERVLRVKDVRTDSGVAPITVLTKPWACPGKCVYCPTEARMPKSYISSEPAAARALSLDFDPYDQVTQRVGALERNGHEAKKIELIIKGGTWSNYPWNYRKWFIKRCFDAANHLGSRTAYNVQRTGSEARGTRYEVRKRYPTLVASLKANETAGYRIIGLTIETRPDWVNAEEIKRLREIGCTRVELGVQTLTDKILEITKRGHKVEDVIRATALLKTAGFKVDYHILPGQPGSTPKRDLGDFRRVFADPDFRPDMVKLYPCVVMKGSELYKWNERGDFKPLEGKKLRELLIDMKTLVPRYCRISRMIRDFPAKDITSGTKITNLRDEIARDMEKRGLACVCLRCREVGHVASLKGSGYDLKTRLFEEWYDNAGGREVFLSIEDKERKAVFAFLRLRLPLIRRPERSEAKLKDLYKDPSTALGTTQIYEDFPVLRDSAIVRELHTYGTALNLKQTRSDAAQHKGYGKMLMLEAEMIAKREGYVKVAVISGIGVREYYKMLGYRLKDTYMVKKIT